MQVQRTVSMSSENHSEAFYSADEDTSHGIASQTSSLRQSIISSGSVISHSETIRNKFSSELSISDSVPEKAHSLERKRPMQSRKSPSGHCKSGTNSEPESNGTLLDSSDSHSVSSTSFISAVSSQEDMTLVNLHMQLNKPIVDSPLLMSSYVSHLTQVRILNFT